MIILMQGLISEIGLLQGQSTSFYGEVLYDMIMIKEVHTSCQNQMITKL